MSNEMDGGAEQLPVEQLPAVGDGAVVRAGSLESLHGEQQVALELLLTGKTIAETARSAGIARSTVYEWLRNDPVFRAAYNEWHDELRESSRSRLLMLTDKATNAVEKALESGDARTALQILKGMGMLREVPPGPTDPDEVKRVGDLQKKKRMSRIEREEVQAREAEERSRFGM